MPYLDEDVDVREIPEHLPRADDREQGAEQGVEAVTGELKELTDQLDRDLAKIEQDQSPEAQELRVGILALKKETGSMLKEFWHGVAQAVTMPVEYTRRWFEVRKEKQLQIPDNKKIIEAMENRLSSLNSRRHEFAMKYRMNAFRMILPKSISQEVERLAADYHRANRQDETKWNRVADVFNRLISSHVKGLTEAQTSDADPDRLKEAVGWVRLLITPETASYSVDFDAAREKLGDALVDALPTQDSSVVELENTYPDLFPLRFRQSDQELTPEQLAEKIHRFFEANHPRELSEINLNQIPESFRRLFNPSQRQQLFEAYFKYKPTDVHNAVLLHHRFFFDQIRQASKEHIDQILATIKQNNLYDYNRQWYYQILFSIIPLDAESAREFFPVNEKKEDDLRMTLVKLRNPQIFSVDPHSRRDLFESLMRPLKEVDDVVSLEMVFLHPEMYGITREVVEAGKWKAMERSFTSQQKSSMGERLFIVKKFIDDFAMDAKEIDRLRHLFIESDENFVKNVGTFYQYFSGEDGYKTLGKLFGLSVQDRGVLRNGIFVSIARETTRFKDVKDLFFYFNKHQSGKAIIPEMLNHFITFAPISELEQFFESRRHTRGDLNLSVLTPEQNSQLLSRLMDGNTLVFLRNDVQKIVFHNFTHDEWRNYLKQVAPTLPNSWSFMVLFSSEADFFHEIIEQDAQTRGMLMEAFFFTLEAKSALDVLKQEDAIHRLTPDEQTTLINTIIDDGAVEDVITFLRLPHHISDILITLGGNFLDRAKQRVLDSKDTDVYFSALETMSHRFSEREQEEMIQYMIIHADSDMCIELYGNLTVFYDAFLKQSIEVRDDLKKRMLRSKNRLHLIEYAERVAKDFSEDECVFLLSSAAEDPTVRMRLANPYTRRFFSKEANEAFVQTFVQYVYLEIRNDLPLILQNEPVLAKEFLKAFVQTPECRIPNNWNGVETLQFYAAHGIIDELEIWKRISLDDIGTIPDHGLRQFSQFPSHPWHTALQRLKKIQAFANRTDHCPWMQELMPLVQGGLSEKFLSFSKTEDGELFVDFVEAFGAYNFPRLFRLFVELQREDSLKSAFEKHPDLYKILVEFFGEKTVAKFKDKSEVINACKKAKRQFQKEILQDHVPKEIGTEIGLELMGSIRGATQWRHEGSMEKLLQTWRETLQRSPSFGKLQEGYTERSHKVTMVKETETKPQDKTIEMLLQNKNLLEQWQRWTEAIKNAVETPDWVLVWWDKESERVLKELRALIQQYEQKIIALPPGAQKGMQTNIERLKLAIAELEGMKISEMPTDMVDFMERFVQFSTQVSRDKKLRAQIDAWLLTLSVMHMYEIAPEGQRDFLDRVTNQPSGKMDTAGLTGYRSFLSQYVREHYLNPHQVEDHIGHKPFSKELTKQMQSIWGVDGDYEKSNDLVKAAIKIETEEQGETEATGKKREISFIPARGLMRIFSGDVGDACYTSRHDDLANGEFPKLTAVLYVSGRETASERIEGSFLLIETKTPEGESVLVVRANNPRSNLFAKVDANDLVRSSLEYAIEVAKARGLSRVVVPIDYASASSSNRAEVAEYYKKQFVNSPSVPLVSEPETDFNGYQIWDGRCREVWRQETREVGKV